MLGLTPARARGRAARDLVHTPVAGDDLVRDAFRSAATERDAVLVTHGGGELPALFRSRRVGRPHWVVLTVRDLTQMRRLQQELRRNERLATLGQLSAGVAHEIRNPLAGIGTSAQVLLRRFEPRDDRARFVRVILDEVERLDRIVTSLLQYARPRTPELQRVPIRPCIEKVIELTRDAVAQAGIEVSVGVPPKLPPLYLDPDLATQVLLNVTLNAIQAMPTGGSLRYEVRALRRRAAPRGPGRRQSDRELRAERSRPWRIDQQVRVIDTGAGIPRGALAKLFDPFFSTRPRGTGLGLSISQTIMQEHGGTIAVASREGRGTTVLLNFPVEKRHGERRQHDPGAKR
jgi:two-component system sensor histidine kinase HydH